MMKVIHKRNSQKQLFYIIVMPDNKLKTKDIVLR